MGCLNKGSPECWQVFDTNDTAPSLCSGEARYGGLSPIVFLRAMNRNGKREDRASSKVEWEQEVSGSRNRSEDAKGDLHLL